MHLGKQKLGCYRLFRWFLSINVWGVQFPLYTCLKSPRNNLGKYWAEPLYSSFTSCNLVLKWISRKISEVITLQAVAAGEHRCLGLAFGLWLLLATVLKELSAFGAVLLSSWAPSAPLSVAPVTLLDCSPFSWVLTAENAIRERSNLKTGGQTKGASWNVCVTTGRNPFIYNLSRRQQITLCVWFRFSGKAFWSNTENWVSSGKIHCRRISEQSTGNVYMLLNYSFIYLVKCNIQNQKTLLCFPRQRKSSNEEWMCSRASDT